MKDFRFAIIHVYQVFSVIYTEKKVIRSRLIFFPSITESKIRSITIHGHMNKPMSNSDSVSLCDTFHTDKT